LAANVIKQNPNSNSHLISILQALFVTFLWSTSWILIKYGLADIPPVTFAGLRYSLAFFVLLPFALRKSNFSSLKNLSQREWLFLLLLGLLLYTVTQGAQFIGLFYLPAVTVNLLLNFTTIMVAIMGIGFLAERPVVFQWGGMLLAFLGAFIYFFPSFLEGAQLFGVAIVFIGVITNALSAIMGRSINRMRTLSPFLITLVSMGFGSSFLLAGGLTFQGLPELSSANWLIIAWLAVVNTAIAFTLWNNTLRTLQAFESSIINSTMLIQIPILAWIFLDEVLAFQEIIGLVLAGVGVMVVQLWRRKP
jgi:drug/metabolite transporter (DMT)-like permease